MIPKFKKGEEYEKEICKKSCCYCCRSNLCLVGTTSAFAAGTVHLEKGIMTTSSGESIPVVVKYLEEEPASTPCVDDFGVTVRDADDIMPTSANVRKNLNLGVGKSYSYGPFYMGANSPWDPNVGDMIDITVSGITSGKYKVIVEGIGIDGSEYNYESSEYSSAKTISLPGEGGVGYTVTVLNTSAEKLKATVTIITYQS